MKPSMKHGIFLAVLAAGLYALSSPFSKLLLPFMPSTLMAGFLYLGAGLGMAALALGKKAVGRPESEARLTRKELPYTIAMIVLDIAAPISLLFGLTMTTAANASLLNNFEIVATAIIALLIFKEAISARLWLGILFVTASCALLSFEDISSLQFNTGSLFVLLACVLLLGFVAYGLSIYYYVYAQRLLGAARTSAYYAVAPFIGAFLSLIIFREVPGVLFLAALALMAVGAWLSSGD